LRVAAVGEAVLGRFDSHGAGQTRPQVSGSGLSRRITSIVAR
jgi:hypothetical protein